MTLFRIGPSIVSIGVRDWIERLPGSDVFQNHHVYLECTGWADRNTVKLRLWGYGDMHPNGFEREYESVRLWGPGASSCYDPFMTKVARLLQEALELRPRARGRLAATLLDSLDGPADPDAEASWEKEIDRRLDALDAGKSKTVPWRRVEKGLLKPQPRRAARPRHR